MQGGFLIYNGITLALVRTNSVDAEAAFTPDGVDYLWTKYTINISAIFNPQQTAYVSGNPPVATPGTLPPDTYNAIRHALMQPRQTLQFASFTKNIISTSGVDANNGPTPKRCVINRIDGCQLYHVNYTIEVTLIECNNSYNYALISNRYSQSHSINREFYTTINTHGAAYFRTDILVQAGLIADVFRNQLLPLLPYGYQRTNVDFRINTAGNVIEYEVRDEQKPYDLGDTSATGSGTFVTNADGFYTLQSISAGPEGMPGQPTLATMNVKLWGGRLANNWTLTQLCFAVISNKLPIGQNQGWITNFSISQSIVERFVEVTISMRLNQNAGAGAPVIGGVNVGGLKTPDSNVFGNFGGINPSPPYDSGTRGDAKLRLLSSALRDACSPLQTDTPTAQGGSSPSINAGPPPQITTTPTNILPSKSSYYSSDTQQAPYTSAEINSYYSTNEGVYQASVAGPQSSPSNPTSPVSGSGNTPTSSILNLHLPMSQRRVEWTVERVGDYPKIPSWNSSNVNEKLMRKVINPMDVQLTLDGSTTIYRISGEYTYALINDFNTYGFLVLDVPQWISIPYGQQALPLPSGGSNTSNYVVGGITDPTS